MSTTRLNIDKTGIKKWAQETLPVSHGLKLPFSSATIQSIVGFLHPKIRYKFSI